MLPTIVRSTEEMLRLVPAPLREGAYALGVPKWKTILRIVLPTALPGIVTGVMLAIARAAGETAPVLLVAGGGAAINFNPFEDNQSSLALFVYQQAGDGVEVRAGTGLDGGADPGRPRAGPDRRGEAARPPQPARPMNPGGHHHGQAHRSQRRHRLLRRVQGDREHQPDGRAEDGHRPDRPVRLRQVDLPAVDQPDARGAAGRPGRGQPDHRRPGHLRPGRRRHRRPPHDRHGLPAPQPVPHHVASSRTWWPGCGSTGCARSRSWTRRPSGRCARRTCGTRSRTGSASPARVCPAVSSSGSASPGPSRSSRRSC